MTAAFVCACHLCHRVPAVHHFWIDRESGYQLICDDCQTPEQRAAVAQPRAEA